jgi:hypothetical protein
MKDSHIPRSGLPSSWEAPEGRLLYGGWLALFFKFRFFLAERAIALSVTLSGGALFASWKGPDKSEHSMMIGSLRIHHRKTTFQVSK